MQRARQLLLRNLRTNAEYPGTPSFQELSRAPPPVCQRLYTEWIMEEKRGTHSGNANQEACQSRLQHPHSRASGEQRHPLRFDLTFFGGLSLIVQRLCTSVTSRKEVPIR